LNDDEYKDDNGALVTDDNLYQALYDEMWIDDSITGNASGSYTFNTYKAEAYLCHNFDLIEECAAEFGCEPVVSCGYEHGAEFWDVSIRCYLLSECLSDVLETYSF
jgi:hypothetical protein